MHLNEVLNIGQAALVTVSPDESLISAARALQENKIGVLLATDAAGNAVGILSERDVARAVADHCHESCKGLKAATVSDYMSDNVVVCEISEEPQTAIWLMAEYGIRHLPITERGKLKGMVSSRDVIKVMADLPLFESKAEESLAVTL